VATARQLQRAESDRRILAAAAELFTELGFDGCTVRAIAERAEIDPALVVRRFGGKDHLFLRVVQDTWPLQQLLAPPDTDGDLVGRWIAAFLAHVDRGSELPAVAAILQAALTRPDTAELLRAQLFEHAAGQVLAAVISGPDAAARAQIAAAALVGVTLARRVLAAEPLASLDGPRLAFHLETMLRALLQPEAPT
jgi:AcrR family transcriptional regulator